MTSQFGVQTLHKELLDDFLARRLTYAPTAAYCAGGLESHAGGTSGGEATFALEAGEVNCR